MGDGTFTNENISDENDVDIHFHAFYFSEKFCQNNKVIRLTNVE